LVASANYRLNEGPLRGLPPGAEAYVLANGERRQKLTEAAERLLVNRKWTATTDFTGSGNTDYLMLYRYIVERKPDYVLELGSGISTLFIACAMEEVGKGHLVTVDHIAHYSEEAGRTMPAELAKRVDFVVSQSVGEVYGGVSAVRYREIPTHPYDMIYVDGPPTLVGNTYFPSTDALHIIQAGKHPADVLIDLRLATVHRYSDWVTQPVIFDPLMQLGVISALRASHIKSETSPWHFESQVMIGDAFETLGLQAP
jgi:predicted O-methyltransferase YrrM